MKAKAGLWIDHKKAVIVTVSDKGVDTGLAISMVSKQLRRSGQALKKGKTDPQHVPADDSLQRILTTHLNVYYDAVIASVRDADAILILGPGEAKLELKKRLEKNKLGKRIVAVETVDKMTDHQVAAKVRKHFMAAEAAGKPANRQQTAKVRTHFKKK